MITTLCFLLFFLLGIGGGYLAGAGKLPFLSKGSRSSDSKQTESQTEAAAPETGAAEAAKETDDDPSAETASSMAAEEASQAETEMETETETEEIIPEKTEEELLEEQVDEILAGMTLSEKIYQMFVVAPEQLTGSSCVTAAGSATKESLQSRPVGGLIYFEQNLQTPDQVKSMTSNIQSFAQEIEGLPLFLCVDEEGGRVTRIAKKAEFGVTKLGPMSSITSAEEAYEGGSRIGSYLSELGLNVDFAPDADVITNSSNRVIGDRSFGSDPQIVTEYSAAYAKGLAEYNVLSTYKHFPGHGATEGDTHQGYAYTSKTYEQLAEAELMPFAEAQDNGIDMIMAAHISVPNVIGDDTPCSLSYKMLTEILREDLGYEGLIITDALNMGAIANNYSSGNAAVKAVKAGVDLILMPVDLSAAYNGVYNAVQDGSITEDRIDESVRRIIRAKLKMN